MYGGSHRGEAFIVVGSRAGTGGRLAVGGQMGVGVHQTGHDPLAGGIDDFGTGGNFHIGAQRRDGAVLHQNGALLDDTVGNGQQFAVNDRKHGSFSF